jgi:hypothetical protein
MEQETLAHQKAIDGISELATALDHPGAIGLGCDPGDVDTPRRELDNKQHDVPCQTRRGPHFHREEVSSGEDVPMNFQELLPGRPLLPLRSRFNAVLLEDGGDGPAPDLVAQIRERALNPRIAPVAIRRRHADNQLPNLGHHRWPVRPAAAVAVVFPGDEVQGSRSDDEPPDDRIAGHYAILAGHSTRFLTASELLIDLNGQATARALERRLRMYAKPALLAIDEIGYLGYDGHAADLLFQVVSRRYEHRSLAVTTNLPVKQMEHGLSERGLCRGAH